MPQIFRYGKTRSSDKNMRDDWDDAGNYYRASAGSPLSLPSLRGESEADVCIVGAGFTGLSTAHFLRQAGVRVAVLERHEAGWGASGRNGGQLLSGFFCDMRQVFRKTGAESGRQLWAASLEGVAAVKAIIAHYGLDCDWQGGALIAAGTAAEEADLEDYAGFLVKNCAARCELWDKSKVTAGLGTPAYRKGLYEPDSGHFHPLKYVRGLARALHAGGVAIYEQSPAESIAVEQGRYRIATPDGLVKAKALLLCGDSYLGTLVPALRRKYVLIRNAVLATEPLAPDMPVLACGAAVTENSAHLHFYRKTADNRLLFGGGDTVIPARSDHATQAKVLHALRADMVRLFPALKNVAVMHEWGGYVGMTSSYLPNIGRLKSGIYYANGFSGHGAGLSHVAARLLADAVLKGDESLRLFRAVRNFSFPGNGRLDHILTMLGMWQYRISHVLQSRFFKD